MKGFSLMELLIAVAIVGILTSIAVPSYMGHIQTSKESVAKNNLRQIYLQQQEYFSDNNEYYFTSASCSDTNDASEINTNLFEGQAIITDDEYNYCIEQDTTDDFTAYADDNDSADSFTIDENNNVNF